MSHGARNWPFLDVDHLAGLRGGDEEIGLPAKERRDLQDVDDLGDLGALLALVNVGEDGDAQPLAEIGEDRQRLVETEAALARETGAVGLVERRLVDEADPEARRHLLQPAGDVEGVVARFELAGPGDERKRKVVAEPGGADLYMGVGFHRPRS